MKYTYTHYLSMIKRLREGGMDLPHAIENVVKAFCLPPEDAALFHTLLGESK